MNTHWLIIVLLIGITTLSKIAKFYKITVLNYILPHIAFGIQYADALHRGLIDPPCMRQFILLLWGIAIYCFFQIFSDYNIVKTTGNYIFIVIGVGFIFLNQYMKKPIKKNVEDVLWRYKTVQLKPTDLEECLVCLSIIHFYQKARKCKSCKKIFHHKCLETWSKINSICPHCRYEY